MTLVLLFVGDAVKDVKEVESCPEVRHALALI
jgi:hypothetical protein